MPYLRNTWYVASFSKDIADAPFARTLLDEPIVFYRDSAGKVSALHDRCPHRFVPLSLGTVQGDDLVCGYHGLKLNGDGLCVDNRFNDNITANTCVRSYPVVERNGLIWIWMGEAERADPDTVPKFDFLDDPNLIIVSGTTYDRANYTLLVDNLLDLSHLDYTHRNSIGNGSLTRGDHSVRQVGTTVHSDWLSLNGEVPPGNLVDPRVTFDKCDSWYDVQWDAPSITYMSTGIRPVGDMRPESRIEAFHAHLVTPETETSSWYLWMISRDSILAGDEMTKQLYDLTRHVFEVEDLPMLEAQQRAMKTDFWGERPVIFPEDAGAVRARRVLDKLIRDEQRGEEGDKRDTQPSSSHDLHAMT